MDLTRRQVLLREFDEVIAPQKATLAGKLQDAFRSYAPPSGLPTQPARLPGAVAGAPGAAGAVPGGVPAAGGGGALARSKRPGEGGGGGSSKRLRPGPPMDENARRLDEMLKEVKTIINRKLWGKKEMGPFKDPVDPVRLNIPDYHTIIKHPMDVGTVRRKLDRGEYSSPLEVRDDLRLVWRNCATYNPPGHSVRIAGDVLAVAFEAAWAESKMEEKWNEFLLQRDPKGLALPHRVGMLSGQIRSTVQGVPSGEPDPSQQMSDIDKRKLSVELSELQGDQLLGVLDILQADMAGSTDKEEIELDMDTLPNHTLWRLHSYVRSITRRALPQSAPTKAAPSQVAEAPSAAGASGAPDATHAAAAPANGGEQAGSHPTVAEKAPLSTSKREDERDGDMAEAEGSQGSDSKSDSQQEFKGSTMDDPSAQNAPSFPKDRRVVDESATGAGEQSTILKEKAGSRKPEVQVNAANWNASALTQPEGAENEENEEAADDEVWKQFQTMDEQKRKQAEDQKKLKEQQEQEMLKVKEAEQEAARKQQQEAEERERKLKEEEERIAQEQQRARMEQCDKEVDEIKARQGTANLTQQNDMQSALMQQPGGNGGLAAVGLVYKNEDEDINFDDE